MPSGTVVGGLPNTAKVPMVSKPKDPAGGNQTFADKGVVVPSKATPSRSSPELQSGLLAFFAGDYQSAVPLLQSAAQEPGIASRASVFLACAKVALVLSGRGDAAVLREARAEFASDAGVRTLTADERRFISPRVLEQLERP
jgi:hypothetical protein